MATPIQKSKMKVGTTFEEEIPNLHPTQFRVGRMEVQEKRDGFLKMGAEALQADLKAHPCPIVIGPDGTAYITDEQHRANASTEAEHHHRVHCLEKHGQPTMFAIVKDSYPAYRTTCQAPLAFPDWMVANNYTFLDDRGAARPFAALPSTVAAMKNDAYRSLSGFLEDKAYNLAPGVFFAQFKVAGWLRGLLKLSDKQIDRLLQEQKASQRERKAKFMKRISRLLGSPAAKGEAWFKGPLEAAKPLPALLGKIKKMAK